MKLTPDEVMHLSKCSEWLESGNFGDKDQDLEERKQDQFYRRLAKKMNKFWKSTNQKSYELK